MTIDREIDALCSIARQYELVADPPYNFALRDLAVALRALQAENARLRAALERCVAIGEDWVNHSTRSMRDAITDTVRAAQGGTDGSL